MALPHFMAFRCLATLLLLLSGAALAEDTLPPGKYRCYQPPSYVVTNWFELNADGSYRPHEGASGRYVYDGATRIVRWSDGFLGGKSALHHPPGPQSPGGSRHTLFFGADARTNKKALPTREQCFLTTH